MEKRAQKNFSRADHLANERTFLAWIRTNLGLMVFGFVVEKFSFFLEQIAAFLGGSGFSKQVPSHSLQGYSSFFGIALVALGAILCLFAFLKFKKTERQINEDTYESSSLLGALLAVIIFLVGVFLVVYLTYSVLAEGPTH